MISTVLITLSTSFVCLSQIQVTDTLSDIDLAQRLAGQGISIFNVTSTCPTGGKGFFYNGASTNLGLDKGIVLTSGVIGNVVGPNLQTGATMGHNAPGDPDLDSLITSNSNDACVLEFDIEVSSDSMTFRYVFGSEEYPEFVNSSFNDVFGFFISGPGINGKENIALIPNTTTPVSINNINNGNYNCPQLPPGPCVNCNYYVDNCGGATLEYDGFTTVLTASKGGLDPCAVYHFKLAVADVSDFILDSGVFLEAGSFRSHNIQIETTTTVGSGFNSAVEECAVQGIFSFKLKEIPDDTVIINYVIGGDAINGVDYNAIADSVVFPPGDTVQNVIIFPVIDGIPENVESVVLYLLNDCNNLPYDSAVLTIQDNITVFANGNSDTICEFTDVQLNATGGLFYTWSPDTSLNSGLIKNPIATPTITTNYSVIGIVGTCSDTADVLVYVSDEFLTVDAGQTDTICLNASSPIDAIINGNYGPFTYEWSPSKTLDNATIQDPLAQPILSTLYQLSVTSTTGCRRTDSVLIEVQGVAPQVKLTADPVSVCGPDTVVLNSDIISVVCGPTALPCGNFGVGTIGNDTVNSSFPTPFQGFWESSRTQFIYKASELSAAGMGYVKITDLALEVSQKNSITPFNDLNIKIGCTDSNELNTFIDSLTLVYNHPSYSTVQGINTFNLMVPYAWDGVSNLVVEICYTNSSFSSDDFMKSTMTNFNASIQDFSFYEPGCGINNFPITASMRPNTTFVFCDLTYPTLTYQWTSKNGSISESIDSAVIYVDETEEIQLTVWDAMCPNTVGIDINVDSAITLNAGVDTMICSGESIILDASIVGSTISGTNFSWSPASLVANPTNNISNSLPLLQNTNFIIEGITSGGCADKDTIVVVVDSTFKTLAGPDQLICDYDDVQLNALIQGRSAFDFTYQWSPSNGLSNPNIQDPIADPAFPGETYILEAISPIGCTMRDTIAISIDSIFIVDAGADKFICNPRPTQLNGSISGRSATNMTYSWTPANELDDANVADPVAIPTPPSSVYSLIVSSPAGCEYSNNITITLSDLVTSPLFNDTLIIVGDTVKLGALISGGSGNFNYLWGPTAGLGNPNSLATGASPDSNQLYTLIVYDLGGMCNDTVGIMVRIEYVFPIDSMFVVPNAFTPNGDNVNNTFYPLLRSSDLQIAEFKIFNRWGNIVHDEALSPWDGTLNGEQQPVGSYVYMFQLEFPDERRKVYHGQVTLIR
ncbi:MAG: T9SS type B sorting domain-containing protein [Chitinophagales bacterium]|nr:T9SS type B sorting domain-containing protein [Chitinophagales bacterium]